MYMQVGDFRVSRGPPTVPLTWISHNAVISKSQNPRKAGTLYNKSTGKESGKTHLCTARRNLIFSPNQFWNCSPGLEDWPGRVMKNVLNKQGGVVISNFDMKISPFWFSGPLLNFHDVGYPIIDSKLSQGIVEFQSFLNPTSCSKFKGHMYSKVQKFTIGKK